MKLLTLWFSLILSAIVCCYTRRKSLSRSLPPSPRLGDVGVRTHTRTRQEKYLCLVSLRCTRPLFIKQHAHNTTCNNNREIFQLASNLLYLNAGISAKAGFYFGITPPDAVKNINSIIERIAILNIVCKCTTSNLTFFNILLLNFVLLIYLACPTENLLNVRYRNIYYHLGIILSKYRVESSHCNGRHWHRNSEFSM